MKQEMTRKGRAVRSTLKAKALREMIEWKWSFSELLYIFGAAFRAKIADQSNSHNRIGKNYFSSHDKKARRHPAGTKLVRGFIRHSGRESTYWRTLYADLTKKQYGGV